MPLSTGICFVCLFVRGAFAFVQAQSFVAIDVKPVRSVDLETRRVRILPNRDLIGHFGQCNNAD